MNPILQYLHRQLFPRHWIGVVGALCVLASLFTRPFSPERFAFGCAAALFLGTYCGSLLYDDKTGEPYAFIRILLVRKLSIAASLILGVVVWWMGQLPVAVLTTAFTLPLALSMDYHNHPSIVANRKQKLLDQQLSESK
jgi:hypothetical protein